MSLELHAFLNRADMLTPHQWQQEITANGFDMRLDHDFDQFSFTGFLPCELEERSTGFEYYFAPRETVAAADTYLAPLAKTFDSVVTFVWGGDLNELAAVLIASASLANSLPSIMYLPDDDSTLPREQALPYAKQQLQQIATYRK